MPRRRSGVSLLGVGFAAAAVAVLLGLATLGYGLLSLRDGGPDVASSESDPGRDFGPLVLGEPQRNEPPAEPAEPEPVPAATEEAAPEPEGPADAPPQVAPADEPSDAPQSPLPDEPQNWPEPDSSEVAEANGERDYGALPDGAVLGLTVDALGIRNAPVWPDDSPQNLDRGVVHVPETSLPWSNTPERNTYLAAHRIGYPGTGSRLLFYNLNRLREGDRVVLRRPDGERYTYRVTEVFVVEPNDSWVMGRVRDRDMVTLQTCTPLSTFEDRLIVRADRV